MSVLVAAGFVAEQTYTPSSSTCTLLTVSDLPSALNWNLDPVTVTPLLVQVRTGIGSPVAEQVMVIEAPLTAVSELCSACTEGVTIHRENTQTKSTEQSK